MGSKYFFSLDSIKPQKSNTGGSLTCVTEDEMSGLVNISFAQLKLHKGTNCEPIWHPNANKIGYCVKGSALVSMRSPAGVEVFTVNDGEMFFIPRGYVHNISNTSEDESVIAFALDHTKPEVMYLSKSVNSISDGVFASTFNTPPNFFEGLKKSSKQDLISASSSMKKPANFISNRFKFNIGASAKVVNDKGGYLQLGIKSNLPVLDGLGILGFGMKPKGSVEPHWHTNAGELVYIVRGTTRISVLSPDGSHEVKEVKGGEGAFAPASHFHYIENIGSDDVDVIAFFSHADPDYIGAGEAVGAFSNDVLATAFNVSPDYFNQFKKPGGPLIIVPV